MGANTLPLPIIKTSFNMARTSQVVYQHDEDSYFSSVDSYVQSLFFTPIWLSFNQTVLRGSACINNFIIINFILCNNALNLITSYIVYVPILLCVSIYILPMLEFGPLFVHWGFGLGLPAFRVGLIGFTNYLTHLNWIYHRWAYNLRVLINAHFFIFYFTNTSWLFLEY